MYSNDLINGVFTATIGATQEAIINAFLTARAMTGINDNTVTGFLRKGYKNFKEYNRIQ